MKQRPAKIFLLGVLSMWSAGNAAPPETLPIPVERFCATHFRNDKSAGIALRGQRFNPSDVIVDDTPGRRIIEYSVGKNVSWLWYEHGGRGLHQHLLSFNNQDPATVIAAYTFIETTHKYIDELVQDAAFLEANRAKSDEL